MEGRQGSKVKRWEEKEKRGKKKNKEKRVEGDGGTEVWTR